VPSQRQFTVYRFWAVLFLNSLTISSCLGHSPLVVWQVGLGEMATAQSSNTRQLVQQGIKRYQVGDFQGAISSWQTVLRAYPERHSYSEDEITVLKYLARAYQKVGRVSLAINHLERVIAYYRRIKDQKQVGLMLTEQAQFYSSLGQQRRAIVLLCGQNKADSACSQDSAVEIAHSQSDFPGQVAALGSLGNAHRLQGEYDEAIQYLEKSLEIAKQIDNKIYISSALNGLANTYTSLANRNYRHAQFANKAGDERATQKFRQYVVGYDDKAVQYFEHSLILARTQRDRPSEMRTLLSLILLYHHTHRVNSSALVNNTLQQALVVLENLPDSRNKAYAAIKLANLLQLVTLGIANYDTDSATQCLESESSPKSVELLNKAILIAQHIQDREAESFALGRLGHIYECRKDYKQALNLTQQAEITTVANESLYLWEWQAGRIFKAQGSISDAINLYEKSVKTLKSIRSDIASADRDFQFDFRDTVEAVYRQLIELILERASNLTRESAIQENLESALKTVDDLRLAELQNYLGNDCDLQPIKKPVALVGRSTAVFSSVILKDRIAIILTLPSGERTFKSQVHWVPVKSKEAIEIINDLRLKLEKRSDHENTFRARTQQVYDWLIRPFVSDLDREKIETLVFIQDGILRSIPMATLHDGKQFLVEKYAIANTPSLTLTNPTQLNNKELRVLAFGLTKPATVTTVNGPTFFQPLSQVKSELSGIKTIMPDSKVLLDKDFVPNRLKQELEKNAYPIIHIATHGKFGIDSRETFLVTGNLVPENSKKITNNEKLTMNQLYQIINSTRHNDSPIELLTLTACETAVGSDRDALGIAGISLQAGSQSAMASLWEVDDEAITQIITKFYQGLRTGLSRAKALQAAQKTWLKEHPNGLYSHPGYWSPFILVGNWL